MNLRVLYFIRSAFSLREKYHFHGTRYLKESSKRYTNHNIELIGKMFFLIYATTIQDAFQPSLETPWTLVSLHFLHNLSTYFLNSVLLNFYSIILKVHS